ncbi:prolyl oligopeptidase family serine peptidase [Mariniblastus sp.]|nr:prolyl oligopeptidase family serine peptidase [Mariniblastus sp.]MDB4756647.1 prolyl oligopeptidase family serine peptidase [Mariniblastus sp.]
MTKKLPLIINALFLTAVIALDGSLASQEVREISYKSSADQTLQPAMFFAPSSQKPVPLMVALHTWSADYQSNYNKAIETWCKKNKWAYIHPNFRGPNRRPEATGSRLVIADIISSVDFAKKTTSIDPSAIYLVGASGGGHAALLMAGKRPDLWAGVSAWVPISDLRSWYSQCKANNRKYYKEIDLSCGGPPGKSPEVDRQYRDRSPLTFLANAKGVQLHIHTGIQDGHTGSVPISHSLRAFNEVAKPGDALSADQIDFFTKTATVPADLKQPIHDSSYGKKQPLFRRHSGNATLTIFNGGHEIIPTAAVGWLLKIHLSKASALQRK